MVSSLLSFQPGFSSAFTPQSNALAATGSSPLTSGLGGLSAGLGAGALGSIGTSALASNPFGGSDPSAPLNSLLGGLPFSSTSPLTGSNASTPLNTILGGLPFSSATPFTGSNASTPLNTLLGGLPNSATNPFGGANAASPLNNILGGLPFAATSPLAGANATTPINTLLGGLPNSNTTALTGVDASTQLNGILASLPFSSGRSPLSFMDPAALLNTLAGTGITSSINPFTGGLTTQTPITTTGGSTTNGQPGTIQNSPDLQQAISLIQQVPEAADLLNKALAKGYSIRIGNPSDGTEAPGVTTEGITNTNGPNGNEIIISPNAKDFIKTLVHETYHAATDGDGDSKTEEATANVIGDRVSAMINNRAPRDPQQIFNETFPLYPDLPVNN